MVSHRHDVVIVGLGGMGSAAAAELARRGLSVLGLERHGPAHDRGSSHGESRMIRLAYFEHPSYVPLLLGAYEGWDALERATDLALRFETGGLMLGSADSRTVVGSLESAKHWNLDYELLDAREVERRWPAYHPGPEDVAVYETRAGFVRPERTVQAHLDLASDSGAELHFDEPVTGWSVTREGVEVETALGCYGGSRLVLSAGPWVPGLLSGLEIPFRIERHVMTWFRTRCPVDELRPDRHPVYLWEGTDGSQAYGFPALGSQSDGMKAAFFRRGAPTDPDQLQREVLPEEAMPLAEFLARRLPVISPEVVKAIPCMYTTTPDEHFVLGLWPGEERVIICSPCSGHGFKFVPVIGSIVADLVERGGTSFDISLFDPARFAKDRSASGM